MKFILKSIKTVVLLTVMMPFVIPQSVVAQQDKPQNLRLYDNQPYHFGFIIGLNQMSYSINTKESFQTTLHETDEFIADGDYSLVSNPTYVRSINPVPNYGFTVGVVGNLRLGKYFDLRLIPSLSFGSRVIHYDIVETNVDNGHQGFNKSIFSAFVEFPLLVKYKSKRYNNFAAYVIGGGNFKIDLASQKKEKTEDGYIKNIRVNRGDIAAEIGAGVDFYTGYFKFGIEAKMSFGLLNIMNPQGLFYDTSINSIQNRMFQISFTFE